MSGLHGCVQVENKRNFVCFIDLSASIDQNRFQEYADILVNDIYQNLNRNDQIRIYPLDYASRIKNDPIYFEDLSTLDFAEQIQSVSFRESEINTLIKKHTVDMKDSLISIILKSKTERNNYAFQTDIMGALQKAYRERIDNEATSGNMKAINKYLNGDKEFHTENYILIFSDMIHEGGGLDFNSFTTLSKADKLLNILEENGQIPNMEHFKIYVNGITARNNKSLDALEHFWQKYFELSKAQLQCMNYNCGYQINGDLNGD